jgi:UDP-N-acetylmuramoyl-L-alanyl-D-glutamate--2,6-diaminopimelate ligase
LAYLSAAFYGHPARKLTVVGVTGTDGKTTTSNMIFEICKNAGFSTGMISTVNAVIGDEAKDTGFHVTTPDSPDVQKYLAQMVRKGITHVVLETTSHGWSQYRVDACEFDIGVVTNITHEHLDEHGTFQNYLAAKARLLESLALTKTKVSGNPRLGVLNADDSSYEYLRPIVRNRYKSFGLSAGSDVTASDISEKTNRIDFVASGVEWSVPVTCKLLGNYNILNCLAALTATVCGLGIDPVMAAEGISNLMHIPGRMEQIELGQNFLAIVDFAHTPNALKNALIAARSFTNQRVIVIFGSAGLRDREKRRLMANISAEFADFSIFTAEDPRTESLDDILSEMADGAKEKGGVENESYWLIPDRGDAIRFGLTLATKGDVVMACGKGHEQSMCFEEIEYPWDDRTAMRAALAEFCGIDGPSMPYLPTQKYH